MRYVTRMACFIASIVVLTGCVHEPQIAPGAEVDMKSDTFSFDRARYPAPGNLFPEYRIAPGDILDVLFQIRSWQKKDEFRLAVDQTVSVKYVHAPNLNETQNVRPDGTITLPYIGDVNVVDKTVPEVTRQLKGLYKGILRSPVEIYVTVPEFSTQIKELKKDLHTAPRGLSRLTTVRPDGYCTFPIIGDVQVANKTIPEVKETLDQKYDAYLPGLHADLFLEKHAGSLVYVVGRVNTPGAYSLTRPVTVLETIALAGGYMTDADLRKVLVFRRNNQTHAAKLVDVKEILLAGEQSTFFYVQPDDIVHVPRSKGATQAEIMREVADILMFRGWALNFGFDLLQNGID